MARAAPAWGLCDITQAGPSPRPRSPRCEGSQTHHEQLPPPSLLAMRTLTWFLFLPLCLSCGCAFMFSSVRGNVKEPQGQAPCGGHFRIRQNLPEHAQGWLASKWLWLLFVLVLYAVLKFRGGYNEKSKEKNPPGLRGCSLRTPLKKNQNASPSKDFTFTTLHQLEMELVKFLSRVRHLKDAAANGNNLKLPIFEVPSDPQSNVTIYEIWGEEECK